MERVFVDVFLAAYGTPPEGIVLDLDATDDPLHGHQEGRFFHGYYGQVGRQLPPARPMEAVPANRSAVKLAANLLLASAMQTIHGRSICVCEKQELERLPDHRADC